MTENQKICMLKHAAEELKDLDGFDVNDLSKDEFLLYGVSLAITQSLGGSVNNPEGKAMSEKTSAQTQAENITDKLQRELREYAYNKREYSEHKTERARDSMTASLENVLITIKEMRNEIYQDADTQEEKDIIRVLS